MFRIIAMKYRTQFNFVLFLHRLRHNVIKTGVKMISLSYSKISLDNIAQKLQLDSAVDAEFIVAKVNFKLKDEAFLF